MLESVHIRDPERVYKLYPHEVSGGMGQRIMIAMMLIPEPKIIIADEPTSALDVTVRRQVLAVLQELVDRTGASLIFISHDLNLVADFCDRVLVMCGPRADIAASELGQARHPYRQIGHGQIVHAKGLQLAPAGRAAAPGIGCAGRS
jgi:peptide/nickel transport system ATP-binding protein